jgi:HCOMODA/2-hydroxy-3-carboxy-muconic semialdehyde decarboxylase
MSDTTDLRAELATATRILQHTGLVGEFGHVSVLTEDPQRYLICPGAGTRKQWCRSTDIIDLDLDDEFIPGRPLELYMHSEIHRANPDIKSLVHVHSPGLQGLAALETVPTDLLILHAGFWPETMPIWDEPRLVSDRDAGKRMVDILGDEAIMLLRWHGAVIVGATLKEAIARAILAEQHAHQVLTAAQHGRPVAGVPAGVDRKELSAWVTGPAAQQMYWDYYASLLPAMTPDSWGAH